MPYFVDLNSSSEEVTNTFVDFCKDGNYINTIKSIFIAVYFVLFFVF